MARREMLGALGFAADARVAVVHVDDVGLCPSANDGLLRALDGAATCGSVMVPCPSFEAIAAIARDRPDLDLGVHLTLCCEYARYRWRPVRTDVPSLCAPDGAMWRTTAEVVAHARIDEVERELRSQIDRAIDAGIDVTHLDAHMGTVLHLDLLDIYIGLGAELRVPLFLPRVTREILLAAGMPDAIDAYLGKLSAAESRGLPLFDHFDMNSLGFAPGTGLAHNEARVRALPAGLSYLITHCASGDAALAAVTEDWRQRGEECELYAGDTMSRVLADAGCQTIGMRPIREWQRRDAPAA